MIPHPPPDRRGLLYAVAAYGAWGVLPLYFRALRAVPPAEILAHRAVWSVLFLALLLTLRRGWAEIRPALTGAVLLQLVASAALLATNWLTYIWCATHDRVLDSSLGYFLNPLVNVVLGAWFLGERLSLTQKVAVGLAATGVGLQIAMVGSLPWPAVVLPIGFGLYGLLRKRVPIASMPALLVESSLMAPFALGWLLHLGTGLGEDPKVSWLLVGTGVVTALPLVWFGAAAKRLSLSTLGLMQYLSPTGQFLLAVGVFGEPWRAGQAVGFGLIWIGLGVYSWGAWRR